MTSAGTAYARKVRRVYLEDDDDSEYAVKREDEIMGWAHDWTNELASGETISSAAYVDSGTTRTNAAVDATNTITSCDVAGNGEFEVTVTLSTGRKLQRVVRFYSPDGSAASDYQ